MKNPWAPSRLNRNVSFLSCGKIGCSKTGGVGGSWREVPIVFFFLSGYDLVIDCTDAPPSRYLLNDAALHAVRPLIAASAVGWLGGIFWSHWMALETKKKPKVFGNTCRILGWELEEWQVFFGRRLQFRGWFSGFHFKLGKVDVCDCKWCGFRWMSFCFESKAQWATGSVQLWGWSMLTLCCLTTR